MEIYFAGSIRGEQPNREWFHRLIALMSGHGRVLTEHSFGYTADEEAEIDDNCIYETDMGWLRGADAIVARRIVWLNGQRQRLREPNPLAA